MAKLQIYDRRERAMVAAADAAVRIATRVLRPISRARRPSAPARILLLRLERIGDLLMALPAIADLRDAAPAARIDLVVGSWNRAVAESVQGIDRVVTMDAEWLVRGGRGEALPGLIRAAASWRRARYDLAINFEPDIRSNVLLAAAGARWTAGYRSGGGGPLLDQALDFDPSAHTVDNARRLISAVTSRPVPPAIRRVLAVPERHQREAASLLAHTRSPRIAMHVPGGRPVKQWPPDRFMAVAQTLIRQRGATIVLTGSPADREVLDVVRGALHSNNVVDASGGTDLLTVAALLERCEMMITGDTGPMHLAAAVGTPIVAVFGPSDPARYAPRAPRDRVVRVDLPCAPCNRIRLPPARCSGRTPDCLALIGPDRVLTTALAVLDQCGSDATRTPVEPA